MIYEHATGNAYETISDFRAAYPLTSFGPLTTEADRAAVGLVELAVVRPPYDRELEDSEFSGIQQIDGVWSMVHVTVPKQLTDTERAAIITRRFVSALYAHIDAVAASDGWDNRVTLMGRAGFVGRYQQKALAFCAWVEACETLALGLMAEVTAGTAQPPETTQALIDQLPAMVWPGASA